MTNHFALCHRGIGDGGQEHAQLELSRKDRVPQHTALMSPPVLCLWQAVNAVSACIKACIPSLPLAALLEDVGDAAAVGSVVV